MRLRNSKALTSEQLYFCYDEKTHKYLYNEIGINHIDKGLDKHGNKYYVYFYTNLLKDALDKLG